MTNTEVAQLFVVISKVFSSFDINNKPKIDLWHALLGDIPFADAKKALYYVLNTNKFEPKPADIREAVNALVVSSIPTAGQAWGEVLKKANIYKANIDWSHDLIRQAVRIIGLSTICESENIGVERAHFFKVYDDLKNKKERRELQISLGLISDIANNKAIGGSNDKPRLNS